MSPLHQKSHIPTVFVFENNTSVITASPDKGRRSIFCLSGRRNPERAIVITRHHQHKHFVIHSHKHERRRRWRSEGRIAGGQSGGELEVRGRRAGGQREEKLEVRGEEKLEVRGEEERLARIASETSKSATFLGFF